MDSTSEDNNAKGKPLVESLEYKEYPYRYVIGSLFFLGCLYSNVLNYTTAPVSTEMKRVYGLSDIEVDAAVLAFSVWHIPVCFPANYLIDDWSLRGSIALGAILMFLGTVLRLVVNSSWWFVLLGQSLAAIGKPLYTHAISKVASTWFGLSSRALATVLFSLALPLGTAISYIWSVLFVSEKAATEEQVFNLMVSQAVAAAVLFLPTILLFREKPATPPSNTATVEKQPFEDAFKQIWPNVDFWLLMWVFGLFVGIFGAISTLIERFVKPFNFGAVDAMYFQGITLGFGCVGGLISGIIVGYTKKYKAVLVFSCIFCSLTILGFALTMTFQSFLLSAVFIAVAGATLAPISPIGIDLGCELTFPIGEAFTNGILFTFSEVTCIILILMMQQFIDGTEFGSTIAGLMAFGFGAIGFVLMMLVKENLKRTKLDITSSSPPTNEDLSPVTPDIKVETLKKSIADDHSEGVISMQPVDTTNELDSSKDTTRS